ncbi:hypothetical protein BVC80_8801g31 [Macleaya cordata]|uniref:Protein TIC 20 n=1 Tax=Macleaya cordata TaxID=56857 RepID=A0A200QED3_MACCD|nr:hypothetical protein BVC80_8801g31 [Macleaya cordata]
MASTPLLRLSPHPTSQTLKKPYFPPPLSTVRFPNPLKTTISISRPPCKKTTICMSYQAVPATERLISAVAYCLPFFNGLQYGRYLFVKYPNLGLVFEPIFPLLNFYRSIPYASFVAFFALYLGVVRNPSFSRFVRFNSMQAVVLDVLLVLPLLVQRVFNPGFSVLGRTPYLPFVADAADRQL